MALDELVFDAWTPMSFKRVLGNRKQPGISWLAPMWVGDHDRRLMAYKVLQAYVDNSSRFFLNDTDQSAMDDHREYGDASLIVQQVLASLLGDDHEIVTDGADAYDPDDPEGDPEAQAAWELQEWLRDWATRERLPLKLMECERNAVGLGDGAYTLGWNGSRGRARLRTYDPGFYFPELDDLDDDEFPDVVHLAWELETDKPGIVEVRRITWRLVELDGGETRNYDWNDEPSPYTCLMTDATWEIDLGKGRGPDDFSEGRATYAVYTDADGSTRDWKDIDLRQDFLPVVHIPNTVALANHYGRSSLATVLQILDDLSNADTDLQASSATTGKPPIVLSGARMTGDQATYVPGEVWEVGENGKLDMLDTSPAIKTLADYVSFLLSRLSVNSRIPEALLGRVSPSEVPSGLALRLGFGPLETMIKEMRQVRAEKYRLLLKFAWRMARANGDETAPDTWIDSWVEFGSFMPADEAGTVEAVARLLEAKAISRATAVRMLQQVGIPIEDANDEVAAIEERDFEGANQLLDALGDEAAVAEYLGREATPVNATAQAPIVPPTPRLQPPPGQQLLPGADLGVEI